MVVGNGSCSLERQLDFDFNGSWIVLEGLLDGPLRRFVECWIEEAFDGFAYGDTESGKEPIWG